MFHLGWIMDYPDPEDIVDLLFYSKSRQNKSKYSNPEFDKLSNTMNEEEGNNNNADWHTRALKRANSPSSPSMQSTRRSS